MTKNGAGNGRAVGEYGCGAGGALGGGMVGEAGSPGVTEKAGSRGVGGQRRRAGGPKRDNRQVWYKVTVAVASRD